MRGLITFGKDLDASGDHTHRWRTVRLLKREGEGKERSVHFLRKCMVCEEEAVKVFYPHVYFEMFRAASEAYAAGVDRNV